MKNNQNQHSWSKAIERIRTLSPVKSIMYLYKGLWNCIVEIVCFDSSGRDFKSPFQMALSYVEALSMMLFLSCIIMIPIIGLVFAIVLLVLWTGTWVTLNGGTIIMVFTTLLGMVLILKDIFVSQKPNTMLEDDGRLRWEFLATTVVLPDFNLTYHRKIPIEMLYYTGVCASGQGYYYATQDPV